ncbi:MAG: hypothetical protein ACK4PG_13825 [Acetobacteraceae bacterium]
MGDERAHTLLAALHEAGHAVMAAACGLPLAHAVARNGRGEVAPDAGKAALLAARHRRRNPDPPPRAARVAVAVALMAWNFSGAAAVELREAARPRAAWRPFAWHYGSMSRGDRRGWYDAAERLREAGIHAGDAAALICEWTDETLAHHAPTLWRLAALLRRRGRLTGPELDRVLAPVAADPWPFAQLQSLTGRIMADPALVWPVECGPSEGCAGETRP